MHKSGNFAYLKCWICYRKALTLTVDCMTRKSNLRLWKSGKFESYTYTEHEGICACWRREEHRCWQCRGTHPCPPVSPCTRGCGARNKRFLSSLWVPPSLPPPPQLRMHHLTPKPKPKPKRWLVSGVRTPNSHYAALCMNQLMKRGECRGGIVICIMYVYTAANNESTVHKSLIMGTAKATYPTRFFGFLCSPPPPRLPAGDKFMCWTIASCRILSPWQGI